MKMKLIFICSLLLLVTVNVFAGRYSYAPNPRQKAAGKTTLADPGEDNYDIKHARFDLHVTDTGVYLWGNVTTTAVVLAPSMVKYVFELDTLMVIDSAFING